MTWYCYKKGSHIVARDIYGLLIRGIPEHMVFTVEAETRLEASNKAAQVIKEVQQKILNSDVFRSSESDHIAHPEGLTR